MPLLVVPNLMPVHRREDGALHLDDKFVSGMSEYAARFPGEVRGLASPGPAPLQPVPNMRYHHPDELSFTMGLTGRQPAASPGARADVALLPLSPQFGPAAGQARRTVWVAEHSGRSRYEMDAVGATSTAARLRARVGFLRWQRRMQTQAASGDGLQCNGWTAWEAFSRFNGRSLRYYDNRLTPQMAEHAHGLTERLTDGVLRLGFSGRLLAIKGPQDAVRALHALRQMGVAAELHIFGVGPEGEAIAAAQPQGVHLHGALDFATEWVVDVPRLVDVMVLPHPQGDPSGTYLESMGVGVPVLGYSNSHWRKLVEESGGGWQVPTGAAEALTRKLLTLAADRVAIATAKERGAIFMREHTMDRDFDARVDHLCAVMSG